MTENIYTDGTYLEKHPTWHVEDSSWKAQQIIRMIEVNGLRPESIGEVGCGAGEVLNQLHLKMHQNISFTGYEISPQAFELCRERTKDRLQFCLTNLFEDEAAFFDIVLAIDVFEHVEDYFGFLRRLQRKGALKVFHIPLDLSVLTVLRSSPIARRRQMLGHIQYFTKETALATLKDTGYEIIDWFYTAGSVDLPAKSFKSFCAKLPRRIFYSLNSDLAVRMLGGYSIMVLAK